MHVLILSADSPPRGVLRTLPSLGVAPIVARPGGETETDGLVQFIRVAARGEVRDPMDLRWSRRGLRSLMRDIHPNLLHIVSDPWTPTAQAGASAARDLKIPYVLVGTSSIGGAKGITAKWQSDRVRDGAVALAGTVQSALDHLAKGPQSKPTAVIPSGGIAIPVHWEPRPEPSPMVFGIVGRLLPERGIDVLLDALAATYGDWRLRIIGTGPSQQALEEQAQRLGLSSRIEWLGSVPRESLPRFWGTVDVALAPSRSTATWVEPTGGIILQAMAHGVAPVVSRCGALPDIVGEGGLIIDEGDAPALSRAIQGLVAEPIRCRAIGAIARERVLERYGDGPVAERMVQLWRRAVGEEV